MTQRINITDLREHLSTVLDKVEAGERFILERDGREIAVLEPSRRTGRTFEEIMVKASELHRSLTPQERDDYLRIIQQRCGEE